jgi:paraquat-inducible protein A
MPREATELPGLRECRDCGLLQRLPEIDDGQAAVCGRCESVLRRGLAHSMGFARVQVIAASVLLGLAFVLPLVELDIRGRTGVSTVFSGPSVLREQGFVLLAVAVFATLVLFPVAKLGVELIVVLGLYASRVPRALAWLFGWVELLSPWAMVEVFLLGLLVAYSRLKDLAHVEAGLASLALGGTVLATVGIDALVDREAIWRALEARMPHTPHATAQDEAADPRDARALAESRSPIACSDCHCVARSEPGAPCPRCGHRLSSRKGRLDRVWALSITSALLYVPANLLPVMTVKRMGKGEPTTILNGVIELAKNHLVPLALLVLVASIIVPVVKLVSLFVMLAMTHLRSAKLLRRRTQLFRLIKFVGRWSMIDVFMLSVLVGVVRFGSIAMVRPELGAMAFCAVVLLTMWATEAFDPRLMWDAAGRGLAKGVARVRA